MQWDPMSEILKLYESARRRSMTHTKSRWECTLFPPLLPTHHALSSDEIREEVLESLSLGGRVLAIDVLL